MEQKTTLIKIGDFFFKYRNLLFPLLLVSLFLMHNPEYAYFGEEWIEHVKDIIAVLIVLAGLSLRGAVIGFKYIKRGGLDKKVYAADLVTDGFFAVCRNPLYVGNFLIYIGVLLMHGTPYVLLLGLAFFMFVYKAIVAAEEYFLRNKFGAAYEAYCADVPRWNMKWSRLKGATAGMKFNFKRVIAKDYTTITNAVVAIVGLELWEEIAEPRLIPLDWHPYVGVIVTSILFMCVVRVFKKRGYLSA